MNKDINIVLEEAPLIILDSKSAMCMSNNGKYNKHTKHISRRVHFVINVEKCKIHKICWCKGGLQLAYIATKNIGGGLFKSYNERYHGKAWQIIKNTCTRGVTGYIIFCGTRVIYE